MTDDKGDIFSKGDGIGDGMGTGNGRQGEDRRRKVRGRQRDALYAQMTKNKTDRASVVG